MGRNFLLSVNFLLCQKTFHPQFTKHILPIYHYDLLVTVHQHFLFFIHPLRQDVLWDYTWLAGGGQVGGVPYSLSGAYLLNYTSYGYETSWVDRSHEGRVQCTGIITLACLIFELLPFVVFHT